MLVPRGAVGDTVAPPQARTPHGGTSAVSRRGEGATTGSRCVLVVAVARSGGCEGGVPSACSLGVFGL